MPTLSTNNLSPPTMQNPPENDIAKKKCSELRKGDRALIFSPLAEILAAFPYNDDLVYIRCRNAVSGGIFEVKWQASKEVDIPKLNRTDYRLVRLIFLPSSRIPRLPVSTLIAKIGPTLSLAKLLTEHPTPKARHLPGHRRARPHERRRHHERTSQATQRRNGRGLEEALRRRQRRP